MARVLVTGAAGFIGRALCRGLAERGHRPVAGLRRPVPPPGTAEGLLLGEITPDRDWSRALRGVGIDIVVHLAQRAHTAADPAALAPEPAAAAALARAAVRAGARRFVYLSSVRVIGEASPPGRPLRAGDPTHPADDYGRAKLASERALTKAAAETGLELVILRPPLVYGPGAGGNFRRLVRLAGSGLPLPFAAVSNCRSLIAVDNLVELVATAAVHPAAAGRILLASDGPALSTAALIRLLAEAQGKPVRLFAVPDRVFGVLRAVPGLGPPLSRLTLSLEVDDAATRAALGWSPPVAAETALRLAARALAAR